MTRGIDEPIRIIRAAVDAGVSERESLGRFGTVMFSRTMMEQLIVFDGYRVSLTNWYALVPDVYKSEVDAIIQWIGPDHVGRLAERDALRFFIHDLWNRIWQEVRPSWGFKENHEHLHEFGL